MRAARQAGRLCPSGRCLAAGAPPQLLWAPLGQQQHAAAQQEAFRDGGGPAGSQAGAGSPSRPSPSSPSSHAQWEAHWPRLGAFRAAQQPAGSRRQGAAQWWHWQGCRGFAAGEPQHGGLASPVEQGGGERAQPGARPPQSAEERLADVNALLQGLDVRRFREDLARWGEKQMYVPYDAFLQRLLDSGVCGSLEEARRIAEALRATGAILRVNHLVYLHPEDVSELVLEALPDTEVQMRAQLQKIEQELRPMERQALLVERSAQRRSHAVLWGGFGIMVVQWLVLARLTFYELSWDVMEPISYFLGSATGIVAYLYFMITKEDFAYRDWLQRLKRNLQASEHRSQGFEQERYQELLQERERYLRYIRKATNELAEARLPRSSHARPKAA